MDDVGTLRTDHGGALAEIVPEMEMALGAGTGRILAAAAFRGHDAPLSHRLFRPEAKNAADRMRDVAPPPVPTRASRSTD